MWIYLALVSALMLGWYDVAKKKSLRINSVMWVLFAISVISTLLLSPFFHRGPAENFILLVPKAALVTLSWIAGLAAMNMLPLTIVSTVKSSRPVFVLIFSMLIFGERLSAGQWCGVTMSLLALWLLNHSSHKEGLDLVHHKGSLWMVLSVAAGVASALYDKYVIGRMDPMFVLCWSNLYITVLMGAVLLIQCLREGENRRRFVWDWNILAAAVLIVCADALYFYALSLEGAMLAIVSILRRSSVLVPFIFSAVALKEKNIKAKAFDLMLLLLGMTVLVIVS